MTRSVVPQPRTGLEAVETERRVVVGVDGSPASVRALMWALEFAESCGGAVEVVTAWPMHAPVFIGEVPGHFSDARWQAIHAQNQAVAHAHELLPGHDRAVTKLIRNDGPLDALLDAADGAALVVLGARRSYPSAPATGTTLAEALQVAAPCPVLEVSAQGVVSLPWGEHAFAPGREASPPPAADASVPAPA